MNHWQIHNFRRKPLRRGAAWAAYAAVAPASAGLEPASGRPPSLAPSLWIMTAVLLMLIGVLIMLKRLRREMAHTRTALKKSKVQLKLMGDKLPSITFFQLAQAADGSFSFSYISKGAEETLNIDRGQLLADAARALDYLYEDDLVRLRKAADPALEEQVLTDLELRILDSAGNLRWLQLSAVSCREKAGTVWDGFVKDISAQKNMGNALIEEKHNFEQLFETIDDFLLVCDMNGTLQHFNHAVERNLGFSPEELGQMSLFELYPAPLRGEMFEVIARMQSAVNTTCSLPLQRRDGRQIPVEMNLFQGLWKDEPSIFCLARNITLRKQTENALRESQQMLQLIMDNIPLSVFWTDKDSIFLGCNRMFAEECNLSHTADVVGKSPMDLFEPGQAEEQIQSDQHVISSNRALLNQLGAYPRADGRTGWREVSRIPLRHIDRPGTGVLGVWRDVTEQHHAEERLKRTHEDLERFNQLMRGRERRTLQLKGEINRLLRELGRDEKYVTTDD